MKVSELVDKLKSMPQDANVCLIYDGVPRLNANVIYESRKGEVLITDCDEAVYEEENWPKDFIGVAAPYLTKES